MVLGWFSTDPLERHLENYDKVQEELTLITAQAVIEKVNIHHAKLFLLFGVNVSQDSRAQYNGHQCDLCSRLLNDKECKVFDNLHVLEASVNEETFLFLIYIAGYVQKKNGVVKENDSLAPILRKDLSSR